ncbi:MAG TPA: hypothetical protein VJQ56_16795 [Blastocatellia bacterium]|nr:hypothetical protein [Blastocatellia bacterium]
MPVQVSIVLDSGILSDPDRKTSYSSLDVGYFDPHIEIYGDGKALKSIPQDKIGKKIEVRFIGGDATSKVEFSDKLDKELLRLATLYKDSTKKPSFKPNPCECVINFTSGWFRPAATKDRHFYVVTPDAKKVRKHVGKIAHDIVVEYEIGPSQSLVIKDENGTLFTSADYKGVARRFDIEIMAPEEATMKFYKETLDIGADDPYLVPNQGNPPPMGAP